MADLPRIQKMAAAINSILNGQIVGGQILFSDGNMLIVPPAVPTVPAVFFPFRTYQPSNVSQFIGQTAPLISSSTPGDGTLTTCTIVDANTPTNLAAMPPQVSVKDSWRFWAVRDGIVEARPIYSAPSVGLNAINNNAMALIPTNTDGIIFAVNSDETFDDSTSATRNPPLVIGSGVPSSEQQLVVLLYLQITQDTSSANLPTVALMGEYYFGTNEISPFVVQNNNQIAVSVITYNPGVSFLSANNYIFDHAINRFPSGNGNYPSGGGNGTVLNIRGTVYWDGSEVACTPSDLLRQVMYPGDGIMANGFGTQDSNPWPANVLIQNISASPVTISDWSTYNAQAFAYDISNPAGGSWLDSNWNVLTAAPNPFDVWNFIWTGEQP